MTAPYEAEVRVYVPRIEELRPGSMCWGRAASNPMHLLTTLTL